MTISPNVLDTAGKVIEVMGLKPYLYMMFGLVVFNLSTKFGSYIARKRDEARWKKMDTANPWHEMYYPHLPDPIKPGSPGCKKLLKYRRHHPVIKRECEG